ncbi:MAG: lytic transglycosylase domain-containing protein [Gammaproteobacteria bacterium]|nr:lytic transglycosylase domain-containing protein [Gammaproteobacteria bacterium]
MGKFIIAVIFLAGAAFDAAAANSETDFLAAREAFRSGNIARLNTLSARLQGHVLEPYVAYMQILSHLKDAGPDEVKDFMQRNSDSYLSDKLRGDWLRWLGKNQRWDIFNAEYPALAGKDTELACYALQARTALGDGAALREAKAYWFSAEDQPDSCSPLFDGLASNGLLTVDDVWARLRLTLEAGNVSVAKHVARYFPGQQEIPVRELERAAENPAVFLDKMPHTISHGPVAGPIADRSPLGVDLKTRAGRELTIFALSRLARSQPQQALPYWNALSSRFSAEEQAYVWGQLALYAARKHDPAALSWFGKAAGARLSDLQLAWKVRAALREHNWQEVQAAIAAMSEAEQNQGAWRYWKARALKAQGKTVQANAIWLPLSKEFNFYGQLAAGELGAVAGIPSESFKAGEDEIKAMEKTPAIRRALTLYEMNLRYEANREWIWAMRGFDDRHLLIAAEVARRHNWYDRAINTADKTVQLHDFSLRFLSPHRDVMQDYVRETGLDEAWVYGLIRQESRFVQQARSGVGASGLMQLMPGTARWVAKRLGIKSFRQAMVNQLDTNLALGTHYLKYVLDKLDGQPLLATAAYNAGPRRAIRWRSPDAMEGAIYAETIPFTETRGYVQKVMSNAVYYGNRFGQQLLSLKQRLGTVVGENGKTECGGNDERAPSCEPE